MKSLAIAATGMLAQQRNIEVISNNIANMRTVGYKRQRAEFQDLLYQDLRAVGADSSAAGTRFAAGLQIGSGVDAVAVNRILTQGNFTNTGKPFDLAIQGEGYFNVLGPNGESLYTRAGAFTLNAEGQIVTSEGHPLQPGIVIPVDADSIVVNREGQVQASLKNQVEIQNLGALQLTRFANPGGLRALGGNMFAETAASGPGIVGAPAVGGYGAIMQYYTEDSNVDPVGEIAELIQAQRAYEMNARVISTSDEMLGAAANLR